MQLPTVTATLLLGTALAVPHDGVSVEDRYIVTLHPSADLTSHMAHVEALHSAQPPSHFQGVSQTYAFGDFQAYSGHFSPDLVGRLRDHKDIQHIEADREMRIPKTEDVPVSEDEGVEEDIQQDRKSKPPPPPASKGEMVEQQHAPWNLCAISQKDVFSRTWSMGNYTYDSSAGAGTYGYVVDSGVMVDHADFQGRASWGYSARKSQWRIDADGHGTHVASIMCGHEWGVAKKCNIISVKALGSDWGSLSTVLDGMTWSVKNIVANKRAARSVINLSVSDSRSFSVNLAVNGAYRLGISMVAAAGNKGEDAGKASPGGARKAITVGATDRYVLRPYWSNYGRHVNIFAPGASIRAANGNARPGRASSIVKSGSSMAAPHVAGMVLYLKGLKSLSGAKATKDELIKLATGLQVHDVTAGGTETIKFAYNGCGK